MGRLFVIGDTHGNFDFLPYFCEDNHTTKEDTLVILGDAGILYYGATKSREKALKKFIMDQPITLFCVRGNHEDRPEDRDNMSIVTIPFGKGMAYCEESVDNIFYAIDGGVYEINGRRILVVGGAYSVDKFYRISYGWKWVSNEQLDENEQRVILDSVHGQHFDLVFTHTCPYSWEPTYLFMRGVDQSAVDKSMEIWLDEVARNIQFDHWYFGHYHGDNRDVCGDGCVTMLFKEYDEIR